MDAFILGAFLVHFAACVFMTGLIWLIQIVHYPAFSFVDEKVFSAFTSFHGNRITPIVLPAMALELVSALFLCWVGLGLDSGELTSVFAGRFTFFWLTVNLLGVVLIWLSTFLASVPAHNQLASEKNPDAIRWLVASNWARTCMWSLRSFGLGLGLWSAINPLLSL